MQINLLEFHLYSFRFHNIHKMYIYAPYLPTYLPYVDRKTICIQDRPIGQ